MTYRQNLCILLIGFLLIGCSSETGNLVLIINGERFAQETFTSKDGWLITFDHVYATPSRIKAYQSSPPYDPSTGEEIKGERSIGYQDEGDDYTIDVAGIGKQEVVTISAPVGQYNAIEWTLTNNTDKGAVRLIGSAERNNETVTFDITLDEEYTYRCGEYLGDERKGIVRAEDEGADMELADLEMTLHLDHIFGDGDEADDATINRYALGFTPLANAAVGGDLTTTLSILEMTMPADQYAILVEAAATLGHVGEGHCYETTYGYTANE